MGDQDFVRRVVKEALDAGVDAAEGFFVETRSTFINVKEAKVDTFSQATDRGFGIRVLVSGRLGFAFTSDLSNEAIQETILKAKEGAALREEDPYRRFPSPPEAPSPDLPVFDTTLRTFPVEAKIDMALKVEQTARAFDRRVSKVRTASYRDAEYQVTLCNSLGLTIGYRGTHCSVSAYVVAEEEGSAETGWEFDFSHFHERLKPEEVGRKAAERAIRMLQARPIATCTTDILLDPAVAADLVDVIAPALTAEAVQKKKSLFIGKVGERIGAEGITLIDDGQDLRGMFPVPYDGEGVPTQRTCLIASGVLKGHLYDTYTGAKDGVSSTGNARRSSYSSPPVVGPNSCYLLPADRSQEELLALMGRGLYVTTALGMHTANSVSGDFSVGIEGHWVEGGKLTRPVRGVTMAGNILDLLQRTVAVGSDLRFYGRTGSPSLLVKDIPIGGT
jgi:PmbA protein